MLLRNASKVMLEIIKQCCFKNFVENLFQFFEFQALKLSSSSKWSA